jgi:hypothetical protein
MRSFNADDIAQGLFGHDLICNNNAGNIIKVQGSALATRDPKAWLADYFYLSCTYDGTFSIKPLIQNVVVDLDFYLGLNDIAEGMYFRLYGPITWTNGRQILCT